MKKGFPETIRYKIFETNSSFHVKWRTAVWIQSLFFEAFLLVLAGFVFRRGGGLGTRLSFYEV